MELEKRIAALYHMASEVAGYDREHFDTLVRRTEKYNVKKPLLEQFAGMIHELQDELCVQVAKARGRSPALQAAQKIMKENHLDRAEYASAYSNEQYQYICNPYMIVRLVAEHALPLRKMDPDVVHIEYEKFLPQTFGTELELPDKSKLKGYIKTEEARRKLERRDDAMLYDFGEGLPLVNAQYLLYIMDILPQTKAHLTESQNFIGFKDDGENIAVLCLRRRTKTAKGERTEL